MPNLRRSLQNKSSVGGLSPTRSHATATTNSSTSTGATTASLTGAGTGGIAGLALPRKVIKALYDYNPQQSKELSFAKGDFFHVVGNEDDEDWYEACNPITGARGYVPVTFFQTLEKAGGNQRSQHRNSNQSLEDAGNDSGSFTDTFPQQYYGQQQQQQPLTPQQLQPSSQHSHLYATGSVGNATAVAAGGNGSMGGISSAPLPGVGHKTTPSPPKCQPLYGIVLYDFTAERKDELDCKVGDPIVVIAQSNDEWYVAKHIGRLGAPGLIPVSYVEVRDKVSGEPINVPEMLRQTGTVLPRVDEWRKQTMEYKANSIALGRLEAGGDGSQTLTTAPLSRGAGMGAGPSVQHPTSAPLPLPAHANNNAGPTLQQIKNKLSRGDLKAPHIRDQSSRRNHSQDLDIGRRVDSINGGRGMPPPRSFSSDTHEDKHRHQNHSHQPSNHGHGLGHGHGQGHRHTHSNGNINHYHHNPSRITQASVESYHNSDDQYWFTVRVEVASGAVRKLYRLYEDFYNFHIALLEEFPVESGRVGEQPRILPFMPIPLKVVDDAVSASRRTDLDGYVHDICKLPPRIVQHPLVENLFAVKDGDSETPLTQPSSDGRTSVAGMRSSSPVIGRSNLGRDPDRRASPAMSPVSSSPPPPAAATVAGPRSPYGTRAQSGGRGYGEDTSANSSPALRSFSQFPIPPITPMSTVVASSSSSASSAGVPGSTSPPPIAAALGSGAPVFGVSSLTASDEKMMKIKIMYRDDIMAMRIPVSIGFKALQAKVFDRLHVDANRSMSYRDDHGDFAIIQTDAHIREAIEQSGGKLMIYVD